MADHNEAREKLEIYELVRDEDVSGISGTGRVGDVVVFPNGKVVVAWDTPAKISTVVIYDTLEDAQKIHGHGGKTRFIKADSTNPAQQKVVEERTRRGETIAMCEQLKQEVERLKAANEHWHLRVTQLNDERDTLRRQVNELGEKVQQSSKPCGAPDCEPYKALEADRDTLRRQLVDATYCINCEQVTSQTCIPCGYKRHHDLTTLLRRCVDLLQDWVKYSTPGEYDYAVRTATKALLTDPSIQAVRASGKEEG